MPDFLERRIVLPLRNLLLDGITPHRLALSMAAGAVIGVFPVLGTTTAICLLAVFVLRLNLPAAQLTNYLVYPLQLALLLPFIRMGQWLLRSERTTMTLQQITAAVKTNPGVAFHQLWRMLVAGVAAWVLFAAIVAPLLYWIFLRLATGIDRSMRARRAAAVPPVAI
ncbi:DUF2062 domain-containing protein [Terriglobus tenax]|uniref:DUF2062 domain-containing protein n=1 Tax=Terriglobus tenax TaxID=1111115 RepID=UPI0021E03565|nr:DUF2062 domain-containing protein [Terriglobus tenax]